MTSTSFRIKGYMADAEILGSTREVEYEPTTRRLSIACSYPESHTLVTSLISPIDGVIAALKPLPPEQQDEALTRIVNAVTGTRAPTATAGRGRVTRSKPVPTVRVMPHEPIDLTDEQAEQFIANTVAAQEPELTEEQAERAAIMEIDGGVPRADAEAAAIEPTAKRPGIDPAKVRALYDAQEQAAAPTDESDDAPTAEDYEAHQARQDGRGPLSAVGGAVARPNHAAAVRAAARVAVADNPPTQARLAYEPEPGQRVREAPHTGRTVSDQPPKATQAPVYEVGHRAASPLDEFMADVPQEKPQVEAPQDLPQELAKANTLRPVFDYLYNQGYTTAEALAEQAYNLRNAVPFVQRVSGLEQRAKDWLARMKEISAV